MLRALPQPGVCRETYAWQSKPELDHIFPFSLYAGKHLELINDIGNMAFLGKLRNIRKSNQQPWEYFAGVSEADLDREFLIERELLREDKFEEFVSNAPPAYRRRSYELPRTISLCGSCRAQVAPFEQGEIGPELFHAACDMGLEGLVSIVCY